MSRSDDRRDELADSLLSTEGQTYRNDDLRSAVFARTVAVIRSRRRLKRCVLAASLVVCYLAGMGTTGIWRSSRGDRHQASTEQVATSQEPLSPLVPPSAMRPVASSGGQVALEKVNCAEVLRGSAERHLLENGDVKLAVRNYESFLNLPLAEQRSISPRQDNWLLMALKDAKSKEIKHDQVE